MNDYEESLHSALQTGNDTPESTPPADRKGDREAELIAEMIRQEQAVDAALSELGIDAPGLDSADRSSRIEAHRTAIDGLDETDPDTAPARRAWAAAEAARWELVLSSLATARAEIRRSRTPRAMHEDLEQEAQLGLYNAACRFDPNHGVRFSTYSRYWVRDSVTGAIDRHGRMIRLPRSARRQLGRLKAQQEARARPTSVADLAASTGMRRSRAARLLSLGTARIVSTEDRVGGHEDGQRVGDQLSSSAPAVDDVLAEYQLIGRIPELLDTLANRDRELLMLRFGLGVGNGEKRTYRELGEHFGVSGERCRQLERRAHRRLREKLAS